MTDLIHIQTYDPNDCASVGYDVIVRPTGLWRVVRRSRWQGTRNGETWIVDPPDEVRAALAVTDDDEPDAETIITNYLHSGSEWQNRARRIRLGWIVR